ncbi:MULTISPECIES: hypothetical protein [Streptomyces]
MHHELGDPDIALVHAHRLNTAELPTQGAAPARPPTSLARCWPGPVRSC